MATGDVTVFEEQIAVALTTWVSANTMKCAILDNTVAPTAADATPALADYTEVGTGGTYAAGGASLGTWGNFVSESGGTTTLDSSTNPSWAQDASNDDDAYWGLIHNDDDTDAAFAFVDLGGPVDMSAGSLTITWNVSGIATIS